MVIEADKIIVGGTVFYPGTSTNNFAIVRYNTDGSLDSTFNKDSVQATGNAENPYSLEEIVLHGNRLYAVGSIQQNGISTVGAAAAYRLEETTVVSCPDDKTLSTDKGVCTAVVNHIDPVLTPADSNALVAYTLTGATIRSGTGSASGTFNKGITTVTYSLTDNTTKTCSFTVTVKDKEAPIITDAYAFPFVLWPPDHQMITVAFTYSLTDNCGAAASLSVTSSEPESGTEPGDLLLDQQVIDAHHVRLRAESSGIGYGSFFPYFGRIYSVLISAKDKAGNKSTEKVQVLVPPEWLYNNSYVNKNKKETSDDLHLND